MKILPFAIQIPSFSSSSQFSRAGQNSNLYQKYAVPFAPLLANATTYFFKASVTQLGICQRVFSAISVIFYRLIFDPAFDPTHPAFQKLVNRFEEKEPDLTNEFNQLESFFNEQHLYSFSGNILRLKRLSDEVSLTYDELNHYVKKIEGRKHPFPIQARLIQVRDKYKTLNWQLNHFCNRKNQRIFGQFQEIAKIFSKGGVELPIDIRRQILQTWEDLQSVFESRATNQLNRFAREMQGIMHGLIDNNESISVNFANSKPLGLRNYRNSCYLDSVLESILCIHSIREKMKQLPQIGDKTLDVHQKEMTIQQEISLFIEAPQGLRKDEQLSPMELILFLMSKDESKGPSRDRLRESIFKSGFHYEFNTFDENGKYDENLKYQQKDAANVMELMIDHFLPECMFKWRGHAKTEAFPGLEFVNGGVEGKDEDVAMLRLSLRNPNPRSKTNYQTLSGSIESTLGFHVEKQTSVDCQRNFDPKEGVATDENEAKLSRAKPAAKLEKFIEWYRLKTLPPVLSIQFKRFKFNIASEKDDRPVFLPEDGILDLSKYYDGPLEEGKSTRYKIKSMVRHWGRSLETGHYVAEVEINDKYFHCNDCDPSPREISKAAFFGHTDPYLLFLEQMPAEEVVN